MDIVYGATRTTFLINPFWFCFLLSKQFLINGNKRKHWVIIVASCFWLSRDHDYELVCLEVSTQNTAVERLTFQFISQLCAIFSCFIFSKVAYLVESTCAHELPELFREVDMAEAVNEHDNNIEWLKGNGYIGQSDINLGSRLHLLKALVKWYNKCCTLHCIHLEHGLPSIGFCIP